MTIDSVTSFNPTYIQRQEIVQRVAIDDRASFLNTEAYFKTQ